jgi:hypothetical protein
MSYSRKNCRISFSNEQIDIIFAWSEANQREILSGPINLHNQTVTSDTTVNSCGDICVQDVTVEDGAKLTLDAAGEVTIDGDFEVQSGAELEIITGQ